MATHFSIPAWESHRQRSLAGYSLKCCKESDRTFSLSKHCNPNQGHLEMASKKVTESVILCAPPTPIYAQGQCSLIFLYLFIFFLLSWNLISLYCSDDWSNPFCCWQPYFMFLFFCSMLCLNFINFIIFCFSFLVLVDSGKRWAKWLCCLQVEAKTCF